MPDNFNSRLRNSSVSHTDSLEKEMATHSSILGKSHGQRSLEGYNPWGGIESDMTEQLTYKYTFI